MNFLHVDIPRNLKTYHSFFKGLKSTSLSPLSPSAFSTLPHPLPLPACPIPLTRFPFPFSLHLFSLPFTPFHSQNVTFIFYEINFVFWLNCKNDIRMRLLVHFILIFHCCTSNNFNYLTIFFLLALSSQLITSKWWRFCLNRTLTIFLKTNTKDMLEAPL